MIDLIKQSIEYRSWGWNLVTLSFIATLFLYAIQVWTLSSQRAKIHRERSAEAVSVPLVALIGSVMAAFGVYGVFRSSLASALNGSQAIFYFLVYREVARQRRLTNSELLVGSGFLLAPFVMVLLGTEKSRELYMLILLFASLFPMAHQPYVMWRCKSAGVAEAKVFLSFSASSLFWWIYAIATGDPVLQIVNPISLVIMAITLSLMRKYRNTPALVS